MAERLSTVHSEFNARTWHCVVSYDAVPCLDMPRNMSAWPALYLVCEDLNATALARTGYRRSGFAFPTVRYFSIAKRTENS